MCGIAGFVSWDEALESNRLDRMLAALKKRGPDGEGRFTAVRGDLGFTPTNTSRVHAALGHARLAIVDLSPAGHEPMSNEDGTLWLTFNGEIYNFHALREELIVRGHRFKSRCDAEILLHGYEQWGAEFFLRLDGMYAFGLLDVKRQELVLCRDMFGIKPLYVAHGSGNVAFASELSSVEAGGFHGSLNIPAVHAFLALGYVPAPLSMWEGVEKLPPGTCVRITAGSTETLHVRQPPLPPQHRTRQPMTSRHVEDTRTAVREAVRSHLLSDVEVGIFLSGGVDSLAVGGAMAETHAGPFRAFTVAMDDPDLDESQAASHAAMKMGARHHIRRVTSQDAIARLPGILGELDEPLADASILPTRLVSEAAREFVKVALSGDGGDELLGGYTRHHLFSLMEKARPMGAAASAVGTSLLGLMGNAGVDALYGVVAPRLGLPRIKSPARKLAAAAQALSSPRHMAYARLFRAGMPESLTSLGVRLDPSQEAMERAALDFQNADALSLGQAMDLRSWLPDDILTKVDRASMAVGLEARVPLLSGPFARHAASLPLAALRDDGKGKRVLREVVAERYGAALAKAPKRGFGIPLAAWLQGPLKTWRKEMLGSLATRGVVHSPALELLQEQHDAGQDQAPLLFALCALEAWMQHHPDAHA